MKRLLADPRRRGSSPNQLRQALRVLTTGKLPRERIADCRFESKKLDLRKTENTKNFCLRVRILIFRFRHTAVESEALFTLKEV